MLKSLSHLHLNDGFSIKNIAHVINPSNNAHVILTLLYIADTFFVFTI